MKAFLTSCSLIAVFGGVDAEDPKNALSAPWGEIRSLARDGSREGSAELFKYLESLTTEEMLSAARQACDERAAYTGNNTEATPEAVAEMDVMLCLHYYFDKVDRGKGGTVLLKIVRDRSESPLLRRALISRMWQTDVPFDGEFQTFVSNNEAKVSAVLTNILQEQGDDVLVRREAMKCLAVRLGRHVGKIIRSDPNVRETLKEKREQTDSVIRVAELVRSGEVSLTKNTVKALEAVEARTIAFVKLLGAILADGKNEPENLQKEAKRRLEGYRKSALTGIDDEVETALASAGE